MARTVIVYGPEAIDCSPHTATLMAKHFGCAEFRRGWKVPDTVKRGALHLTPTDPMKEGVGFEATVEFYTFEEAMAWAQSCEDQDSYPVVPMATKDKDSNTKATNPKDAVGSRKWRILSTVPLTVIWETGVAMLEGALKYGRHNYRSAGVRTSVYVDAAMGHIGQYWEGENIDPDSGLSHITKAIASLVVLRDAEIRGMVFDDRPPKSDLGEIRTRLQKTVDDLLEKYPDPVKPFTEIG